LLYEDAWYSPVLKEKIATGLRQEIPFSGFILFVLETIPEVFKPLYEERYKKCSTDFKPVL
jgi:hypothetical protein